MYDKDGYVKWWVTWLYTIGIGTFAGWFSINWGHNWGTFVTVAATCLFVNFCVVVKFGEKECRRFSSDETSIGIAMGGLGALLTVATTCVQGATWLAYWLFTRYMVV